MRKQHVMITESVFSPWCQEKRVTAGHCLPFLLLELKMVLETQ